MYIIFPIYFCLKRPIKIEYLKIFRNSLSMKKASSAFFGFPKIIPSKLIIVSAPIITSNVVWEKQILFKRIIHFYKKKLFPPLPEKVQPIFFCLKLTSVSRKRLATSSALNLAVSSAKTHGSRFFDKFSAKFEGSTIGFMPYYKN